MNSREGALPPKDGALVEVFEAMTSVEEPDYFDPPNENSRDGSKDIIISNNNNDSYSMPTPTITSAPGTSVDQEVGIPTIRPTTAMPTIPPTTVMPTTRPTKTTKTSKPAEAASTEEPTSLPTFAPTALFTSIAPNSMEPTTSEPTLSPTPKPSSGGTTLVIVDPDENLASPTSLPTSKPINGTTITLIDHTSPNDKCAGATPISMGQSIAGSTMFARSDDDFITEYCSKDGTSIPLAGGEGATQTAGVWFRVNNTGGQLQLTINSNYDMQLSVFELDSDEDDANCQEDLVCVTGTEGMAPFYTAGSVVWNAEQDRIYYIFVHGFQAVGDFDMLLGTVTPPENYQCANAIQLEPDEIIAGSTAFAAMDDEFPGDDQNELASCSASDRTSPGNWYSLTGTGKPIQLSFSSDFEAQLTVFSRNGDGKGCDSLKCVGGIRGSPPDFMSGSVSWDSRQGLVYYILMHGVEGQVGDFDLRIGGDQLVGPQNNICSGAEEVPIAGNVVTEGSTIGAGQDLSVIHCGR
jgi:hypothetical protein